MSIAVPLILNLPLRGLFPMYGCRHTKFASVGRVAVAHGGMRVLSSRAAGLVRCEIACRKIGHTPAGLPRSVALWPAKTGVGMKVIAVWTDG
jgi:hypothetical protein